MFLPKNTCIVQNVLVGRMDFIILTFFNATELIEVVVQISFEGSDNLALILCSKHFREV